jgi:flagellar L-ring protein FlgH
MKIARIIAGALLLALISCQAAAFADSLMTEGNNFTNLYGSNTATRVGDVITIIFREKTTSSQDAKAKLKNTYTVGTEQGQGYLQKFLGLGLSGGETTDVQSATSQNYSLSAAMGARVKEVLPNGQLLIEGEKNIEVNHENQRLYVTGVIRTFDIAVDNTIDSNKIANMKTQVNGLPLSRSIKKRRGGILSWVWGLLF